MALSIYNVNGDLALFKNILQNSGLFVSVTDTTIAGTTNYDRTISASDAYGVRFQLIAKNVSEEGVTSVSTTVAMFYYHGNDMRTELFQQFGSAEAFRNDQFPRVVYTTTSSIVIKPGMYTGMSGSLPLRTGILTKDNNGELLLINKTMGSVSADGISGWNATQVISRGVSTALAVGTNSTKCDSATTLVPYPSTDVSKTVFTPKVYRAVFTQVEHALECRAVLNENEYLSLNGACLVRCD